MSLFSPMSAHGMRVRLVQAGAAIAAAAMIAGCGSAYRPVVTPINPSGPAQQPNSLVAVVSVPSPSTAGIATIIDYSGDTIVAQQPIGPGPLAFTVDGTGSTGYTVNSDGTLTNFPFSNQLQEKNINYSTLPSTAVAVGLFSPSAGLWVADQTGNVADVLTGSGSAQTFKLAIPVAPTPVEIAGPSTAGQYNYAISLNNSATTSPILYSDMTCNTAPATVTETGEVDVIGTSNYFVSARIPAGKCPVFAVQSTDNRRLFILNRGSDTITVVNSQNQTLDTCAPFTNQNGQPVTCHPTLPLTTAAATAAGVTPPQGSNLLSKPAAGPVYAEYSATTSQLIVADYDGGAVSVIDVSLDQYGNDSPTFGTTFTIPVGNTATPNPASVTVVSDLSGGNDYRAYTANQNDDSGTGNGTVSIVDISSHTLEKTLPVVGHPRTVTSTSNSLYGKVYVASPDSPYLTIIRTDQDIIDATVLVPGNVMDVRVSTQTGTSGNSNTMSRRPGAGQPCYLPGAAAEASLAACQSQTPLE